MMKKYSSSIIVAAGTGSRMNSVIPKQFLKVGGKPVLYHTIIKFDKAKYVKEIILVISPEYIDSKELEESIPKQLSKTFKIVQGGDTRQQSVKNGLDQVSPDIPIVMTHDGVRPLIEPQMIDKAVIQCGKKDGVIFAIPAMDTLKEVENNIIKKSLDRDKIWQMQTPQVFKKEILQQGFDLAEKDNFFSTDEASLVERLGIAIHIIQGKKSNIKLTVKEDIQIVEALLKNEN